LGITGEVKIAGLPSLSICHGSPYRVSEKLLPDDERTNEIISSNNNSLMKLDHGRILSRAMNLCREETGECVRPDIPDKYWQQAYNEMEIRYGI